jgi:hypothetical protein
MHSLHQVPLTLRTTITVSSQIGQEMWRDQSVLKAGNKVPAPGNGLDSLVLG